MSRAFVVKSQAPPPLPLLVGVLNTTSPSFGIGWYATFIRVKGTYSSQIVFYYTVHTALLQTFSVFFYFAILQELCSVLFVFKIK